MVERKSSSDIRQMIFDAQKEYSRNLAGKVFLYVYGQNYFEVMFRTNRFKHLTGVESSLSADRFYKYAGRKILTKEQFGFSSAHPKRTSVKKLLQLKFLSLITKSQVCVLKDVSTMTFSYKLGLTNLDFTLCLINDTDNNGVALSDCYVPMSFRVKDRSVENSKNGEFIDFILEKTAGETLYNKITFAASDVKLPQCIAEKIDTELYSRYNGSSSPQLPKSHSTCGGDVE